MSASASPIPPWLHMSHSPKHLSAALRVLAKRERTRDTARTASRRQSEPSTTRSHFAHLGASVLQKDDYTKHYAVSAGCQPENQWGNRYLQLEPYDRTRVVVGPGADGELAEGGAEGGRYLNASWVRELFGGKWWIATQAPLPNTAHPFLSVILQPIARPPPELLAGSSTTRTSRVRTVVQLTPNFERGRQKAHIYFPANIGESWEVPCEDDQTAPPLKVTLLATTAIAEANCMQSTVSIAPVSRSEKLEPIIFQHLLYHAWPDHGIPKPEDRPSLIKFIRLVDQVNKTVPPDRRTDLDPDPPIIVGCSAGIGRTGSFIALSSLLRAHGLVSPSQTLPPATVTPCSPSLPPSPLGPLPNDMRDDLVANEIDSLREQRPGMVQREEQALLIYEMLEEAFLELADSSSG
ncbi:hypothetical protein PLICRDRAFT_35482 [Plicaturopsis crispa FD-325 SS-3]|nr:hypothetical protein PLICRDRAFT_35482 [Plicaturopsis crispa FD-325 SS-3]